MASIEITWTTAGLALTALGSLLTATWALSRRSQRWDTADELEKVIYGDPKSSDPIIQRGVLWTLRDHLGWKKIGDPLPESSFRQVMLVVATVVSQMKGMRRGLGAHKSDEHSIELAVRKSLGQLDEPEEQAPRAEVRRNRRGLAADQGERFAARESVDAVFEEEDPFPAEPQPDHRAPRPATNRGPQARPALRPPIPREEPSGGDRVSRPGGPEDTGRFRGRR